MNDPVLFADWTLKATLVLAAASLVALLLRGRPKLRRMVWVAALLLVPFLPLAGILSESSSAVVLLPNQVAPIGPAGAGSQSWLLLLWLTGLCITALWFGAGYLALIAAAKGSRAFSTRLKGLPEAGLRRKARLRIGGSNSVATAITFGIFRPVVLLPAAAETWSEEEMRAVLLHELEHVRSFDSLVQLVSQSLCAIFWFNPAVWLAARALRAECEASADEAVVDAGVKASDYASLLLDFAAGVGGRRAHRLALSIVRTPDIEPRIRAIVGSSARRSRPLTTVHRLVSGLAVAGLFLAAGCWRLASAQTPASHLTHSEDWLRGYEFGRNYKANHRTSPSTYKPRYTPEQMREIELRAMRELKARGGQPPP